MYSLNARLKIAELLQRVVDIVTPYADVTPMRVWLGPTLYVVITKPRDIEVIVIISQIHKTRCTLSKDVEII